MPPRLAIVGAGPIGLEAALLGVERGFDVTVLEACTVGRGIARWGATRCFSPFGMNSSARLRAALGGDAPKSDELMLGPEIVERVLRPVAKRLGDRVRERCRVLSIGRARMGRQDHAQHPVRAERPFRLLVETPAGEELIEADRVLDASGVYGQPVSFGAGPPAIGERALDRAHVIRQLGGVYDAATEGSLRDRRVLLVGHGHSAAHAILALEQSGARVVWAIRSAHTRPVQEIVDDPLPERARVASGANELAASPPSSIVVERRAHVERLTYVPQGIEVRLTGERRHVVDLVVALTGYRPDLSFLDELAVEISPVNEGAARLHRAIANVTDCLDVPKVTPADLASGEPGFHLVGSKSYGRSRTFLLRTGIEQLETIVAGL